MILSIPKMRLFLRRAKCPTLALVVLSGIAVSPALGQTPGLELGTRLRITIPCDAQIPTRPLATHPTCLAEGQLLRLEGDSLSIAFASETQTYAISHVDRAEVSRGRHSKRWLGAGVGGVIGTVATYVVLNTGGSTASCDQSANQDSIDPGPCLGLYVLGGLAGAGLGFVVGGLVRTERW